MYWILDNTWMHPVRTFISSKFDAKKDSQVLAHAITQWSYLFPPKFIQKLLELYIKPKLKREISDNWNPKDIEDESNLI